MHRTDDLLLRYDCWEDFQRIVESVNPDLSDLLSHRLINQCCDFYLLEYNFGDLIIKDGHLQLPVQEISESAINDLKTLIKNPHDYFVVVLNKPLEQFVALPSRVMSLNIFQPGSIIQIPQYQGALAGDFNFPWQLSAGLRTLFLLPKITDNMGYNRLRLAYQLTAMKPLRNFYDQWHIFRQIAQHPDVKLDWHAKLLVVSKKANLSNQVSTLWQNIQRHIQQQQQPLRLKYSRPLVFDIIWQIFLESVDPHRFKPKLHLVDTIKHLYAMGTALVPGFVPASHEDDVAPISQLSAAFTQVYKLRNYFPTFMHLASIEQSRSQMIYYSMAFPQLINHQASHAVISTSQRDLYELKQLIESVQKVVSNPMFERYQCDYFHIDSNKALNIRNSVDVLADDPRFMLEQGGAKTQREFCASSVFWRGCIRLKTL